MASEPNLEYVTSLVEKPKMLEAAFTLAYTYLKTAIRKAQRNHEYEEASKLLTLYRDLKDTQANLRRNPRAVNVKNITEIQKVFSRIERTYFDSMEPINPADGEVMDPVRGYVEKHEIPASYQITPNFPKVPAGSKYGAMDRALMVRFKKAMLYTKRAEEKALKEGRQDDADELAGTYAELTALYDTLSTSEYPLSAEDRANIVSILDLAEQFDDGPAPAHPGGAPPSPAPTGPPRRPGGSPASDYAGPPPPAEYDFASPAAAPPPPAAVPDFAPVVPSPKSRGRSPPPELDLTPPLSPFSQKPAVERSPLSPPRAAYIPRQVPAPAPPPRLASPPGIIQRPGRAPVRENPFGKRK